MGGGTETLGDDKRSRVAVSTPLFTGLHLSVFVPRALRNGLVVLRARALLTAGFCAHPISKQPDRTRTAVIYDCE